MRQQRWLLDAGRARSMCPRNYRRRRGSCLPCRCRGARPPGNLSEAPPISRPRGHWPVRAKARMPNASSVAMSSSGVSRRMSFRRSKSCRLAIGNVPLAHWSTAYAFGSCASEVRRFGAAMLNGNGCLDEHPAYTARTTWGRRQSKLPLRLYGVVGAVTAGCYDCSGS
jgi:hypothetical protein